MTASVRIRVAPFVPLLLSLACAASATDGGSAAPESLRESNASLHERLADRALSRGDLDSARDSSREALRLDPSRVDAAKLLARAELFSGRPREALGAALRAARLAETDPAAWLVVFECADAAGERTAADHALTRAIELGSTEAELARAGLALESGDEAPIRALLSTRQDVPAAAALYAERLARNGRIDDAVAVLDRALALAPDPQLAATRARLRAELGVADERPAGADRDDRFLAASFAMKDGDWPAALAIYRQAARAEPTAVGPRLGLGEALLGLGDHLGAEAAFEAALEIDPRDVDALLGLARVRLHTRSFRAAIQPLERAIALRRDLASARGLLVAAAIGVGDLDRARSEAADLRRLDPGGALDLKCRALIAAAEESAR